MSTELLATTEKLDGVVSGFAAQLQEYVDRMRDELNALSSAVNVLGGGWEDSNYQAFSGAMAERMANINNYKYDIIWEKQQATNPFFAKKGIMRIHEFWSEIESLQGQTIIVRQEKFMTISHSKA